MGNYETSGCYGGSSFIIFLILILLLLGSSGRGLFASSTDTPN